MNYSNNNLLLIISFYYGTTIKNVIIGHLLGSIL